MRVVPAGSAACRSVRVRWAMAGAAAGVVAADQVSKSLILASRVTAAGTGPVMVRLLRNTGASGGIEAGHPVLVTLVGLVISLGAVVLAIRVRSRVTALCLAAVCGGAIGNLSDRVLRAPGFGRGGVIDWIHVAGGGGSFNVADLAIQFGAIAAVVAMFAAEREPRIPKAQRPAGYT
ncbi:MAG: signal peptidase II [Streptosporangiales bacterium]|nr:signal peptidase II [Streptosporangiales bacterium]